MAMSLSLAPPPPPSPSLSSASSSSSIISSSSSSSTSTSTSGSTSTSARTSATMSSTATMATATTCITETPPPPPPPVDQAHDHDHENDEQHHPAVVTGGIAFPAGNDDFRAARNYCAEACRHFNNTPEDAAPEVRSSRWLDIIRPARDRTTDTLNPAITHDMTFRNPQLKSQTPFVKPPFHVDYGLRVRIGASTFINRGCMIMDTPVADVVIGERCNVGPNCCIVSVGHALLAEERLAKQASIGKPITVGDGVWIGANVTILGGVTIGDGAVIGAGSVITKDIPAAVLAYGVPARVMMTEEDIKNRPSEISGSVATLGEAMIFDRSSPMDRLEELEVTRLSSGLFRRLPPSHTIVPVVNSGSAKHLAVSSASSSASGRTPGTPSCSESTIMVDDDTDDDEHLRHGRPTSSSRRRRRRDRSMPSSRSGRQRMMMRNCPRLFKSEIMAVVVITSVAFTLLTCLFFAGVLMGAKWFAVLVNSPSLSTELFETDGGVPGTKMGF